jgi:ABC-type bacteriocin/lantibiotic exporter with double-glycine peptidase domain
MNNDLKLILSTFTKQQHLNDCGIACLESIFKYTGIDAPVDRPDEMQQLSLLKLQELANGAGLNSSSVKMDIEAVRQNKYPCILHIMNDSGSPHFIVHYPYKKEPGYHLIGDPDRKIELVSEETLLMKWVSRSGLYIENVEPRKDKSYRCYPWDAFTEFRLIPKILWLSIPFLSIVGAFLGLSVSLIIQKAVEPDFINGRQSFFFLLFILLLIISLARCLLNYFRQRMMISIGLKIDSALSPTFINNAYQSFKSSAKMASHFYMAAIADIQKIHQAIALLIGVAFSDGILVMIMLGALYYYQPFLIIIEFIVLFSMLIVIDWSLPLMVIQFESSQPNLQQTDSDTQSGVSGISDYQFFSQRFYKLNDDFSTKTKVMSALVNKINLSFDGISAINLIIVLFVSVRSLQSNIISYEGFLMTVLLCYGMMLLMSKICNQLFVIAQGAQRLKQNVRR